jgi:predicted metal-dependent HD superfamily phosphohydrolase
MENDLLKKAREHSEKLLTEVDPKYCYHNLEHTQDVVSTSEELGKAFGLKEEELEILLLAAMFHDTGFTQTVEGHELVGAGYARTFLENENYQEEKIVNIHNIILSTAWTIEPTNDLEKLINDADLSHVGKDKYFDRLIELKKEWETIQEMTFTDLEWYRLNLQFLAKHSFCTTVAKERFEAQKEANLQQMKTLADQSDQDENKSPETADTGENNTPEVDAVATDEVKPKPKKKKAPKKKPKKDDFGRGVETMFRVTLKNHMQLSQIADNKANIMLSINAIIISVILSSLLPQLDDNTELLVPSMILLTTCVVSIVFATISTIPKVSSGHASRESIRQKSANLLFFGNFHDMDLEDYQWGMGELMKDKDYVYSSMMKDLYFLGKVLHKKYKYLRFTYAIFMSGMVAAVLAFIFVFLT